MTKTRKRTVVRLAVLVVSAAAAVITPSGLRAAGAATIVDQADGVEVFERDVREIVVSTLRTPDADTDPDEPLFNVAGVALESAPGDPVTWGEWSSASASSDVVVVQTPGGRITRVRLVLSGLVPGGLYSAFWGTLGPDSEQPLCPHVERTLPLDVPGGGGGRPAPNAFVADARGNAAYVGEVNRDLFTARQVFFQIVWQFSGGTSYPFPNRGELLTQVPAPECRSSFGEDAMRHLLILQKW
jgi:hypothetical protein